MQAAAIEGTAHAVYNGKPENYKRAPAISELDLNAMAQYVHFTSNETIQGIQYQTDPKVVNHLICDMSSDILSRPVEIANYDLIYAGAQKNMGPAGMTLVIISERLIHRTPDGMHPMLDYRLLSEKKSLYNTPCTFSIYVSGLVYKKLLREGGLTTVQSKNAAKAEALYHEIDSSEGFYTGHALSDSRSQMNVTFTLPSEPLTTKFLMEAALAGMVELKGHRSVGGCRASIYNAFPLEGCLALATFMGKFAQDNR